jgi:hypothetical protein
VSGSWYATRDQIRASLSHAMWCIGEPTPDDGVLCSCGWSDPDTMFGDRVVLTDIELSRSHSQCIVAFPELDSEDPASGETLVVIWNDDELRVEDGDLEWILAQPELPDAFRRAAAVHLDGSASGE